MRPSRSNRPTLLFCLCAAWILLTTVASGTPETAVEPPGAIHFVGKNGIATANGVFHAWKVSDSQVDLASLDTSFVEVEVDVASLDTANEERDEHLRTGDFFEVEKFPTATARVHSAVANGSDESGRAQFKVTIDLTIRGATHAVPGTLTIVSESPLQVEGELSIDRTRWGIGEPNQRFNPMSIGNDIPITFEATLVE